MVDRINSQTSIQQSKPQKLTDYESGVKAYKEFAKMDFVSQSEKQAWISSNILQSDSLDKVKGFCDQAKKGDNIGLQPGNIVQLQNKLDQMSAANDILVQQQKELGRQLKETAK